MRVIYSVVLYALAPLVLLRLLLLGFRSRKYLERWQERLGFFQGRLDNHKHDLIWIHAVSVGEVLATRPLVARLRERFPEYTVLISTVTVTGAATVRQHYGDSALHIYCPYDLPDAVARTLNHVQPRVLLLMETEIWPNLLAACASRQIPTVIVNARLSPRSARNYALLPRLTRSALAATTAILAQSEVDADRFRRLGAEPARVHTCGNIKFDVQLAPSVVERGRAIRYLFSESRSVWIAASTHETEDEMLLQAQRHILATREDCLLIIAPRHPERFNAVFEFSRRLGLETTRRSEDPRSFASTEVFLLDTLGELPEYYASADLAFVGGSLIKGGGHNMLEPASLGIPVITGPHTSNFQEVREKLAAAEALHVLNGVEELPAVVLRFLADANLRHRFGENGRQVVAENTGASAAIIELIGHHLGQSG